MTFNRPIQHLTPVLGLSRSSISNQPQQPDGQIRGPQGHDAQQTQEQMDMSEELGIGMLVVCVPRVIGYMLQNMMLDITKNSQEEIYLQENNKC